MLLLFCIMSETTLNRRVSAEVINQGLSCIFLYLLESCLNRDETFERKLHMHFVCTRKVVDKLEFELEESTYDDRFAWIVNEIQIGHRKAIVFVHEKTALSLIVYGSKKKDFKNLDELLERALHNYLIEFGVDDHVILQYFDHDRANTYHALRNRKHVAVLNHIGNTYKIRSLYYDLELDPNYLIRSINEFYSVDRRPFNDFIQMLNDLYGSAIHYEAYVFEVRLLEKEDCYRILQVPSMITFDVFHMMIQALFGWTNSHLHRFKTVDASGKTIILVDAEIEVDTFVDVLFLDEREFRLKSLVNQEHIIHYSYDFGRDWECEIRLREVITSVNDLYAKCLYVQGIVELEDEEDMIEEMIEDSNIWGRVPLSQRIEIKRRYNSDPYYINQKLSELAFEYAE